MTEAIYAPLAAIAVVVCRASICAIIVHTLLIGSTLLDGFAWNLTVATHAVFVVFAVIVLRACDGRAAPVLACLARTAVGIACALGSTVAMDAQARFALVVLLARNLACPIHALLICLAVSVRLALHATETI